MVKTSSTDREPARDPEATRQALVRAAAAEFARAGFDGARTRGVAAVAGVNPALIRYHFGGKSGLYRAVVSAAVGRARVGLAALRRSNRPAPERLGELVDHMAQTFSGDPHLPAMLLREHLEGGKRLTPEIMAEIGEFFATTRTIVEAGVRAGELRDVDAHTLHLSLIGSLTFFFASQAWRERAAAEGRLPAKAPSLRAFTRQVRQQLIEGVAAPPRV